MRKTIEERLAIFDAATRRQALRNARATTTSESEKRDRGWKREDLYDRRCLR
jgi:hypothetical protein